VDQPALRESLRALAANHSWTWNDDTSAIFRRLPTWEGDTHPAAIVAALDDDHLADLLDDGVFAGEVTEAAGRLAALEATAVTAPDVAYFSPEFGITELVPQYSGGLGILAGDHLKSASDLGTSLGAVGLFYRHGFFRQSIDHGQQAERTEVYQAEDFGYSDTGIVVEVPIADRVVLAKVWRVEVGRVPLLLLDTDLPENQPHDRQITDGLYGGDRLHRLEQELVLGVGGVRAVRAAGWDPGVFHSNEGHAGFLTIELLDAELERSKGTLDEAVAAVKPHVLFTTHTPVPAGIDRFDGGLIEPHLRPWIERWGFAADDVLGLGADPDDGLHVFNMAALCLRLAAKANGVSKLHGEVSRKLFANVPGGDAITSITNGVHARTWVSPPLQRLFDERLGDGWDLGRPEPWRNVDEIDDGMLIAAGHRARTGLVELLAERSGVILQPDAVVVGFARRFAAYKRADLLLRHPARLSMLLADDERPVHFVFAGKAHPADGWGKQLLANVVSFGRSQDAHGRFSFVADYDIGVARAMYAGCDVWLNNPVRPREASGTSGEKAALNGAINCSILDGWWAEMSDGRNGYDIATSDADDEHERDVEESAAALGCLEQIVAEFHADGRGRPSAAWLDRVRHNWRTLGPQVTAARMVDDYQRQLYSPLLHELAEL
jgi:starch phosphorylase